MWAPALYDHLVLVLRTDSAIEQVDHERSSKRPASATRTRSVSMNDEHVLERSILARLGVDMVCAGIPVLDVRMLTKIDARDHTAA